MKIELRNISIREVAFGDVDNANKADYVRANGKPVGDNSRLFIPISDGYYERNVIRHHKPVPALI